MSCVIVRAYQVNRYCAIYLSQHSPIDRHVSEIFESYPWCDIIYVYIDTPTGPFRFHGSFDRPKSP